MQFKVIFESNNIPIRNPFGNVTLRGVKLVRMPCFTSNKHLDRKSGCPRVAKIDPLFTTHCGQKMDRIPAISVLLADGPSAMPILVLEKVRNPIHAPKVAKLNDGGNAIARLSKAQKSHPTLTEGTPL